mgnify:CR=1 FL=1
MIDTDKYEGHTPAPWNYHDSKKYMRELLAEIKRLREWENRIRTYFGDEEMMDFYDWMKEKYGDEEE